MVTILDGKVD